MRKYSRTIRLPATKLTPENLATLLIFIAQPVIGHGQFQANVLGKHGAESVEFNYPVERKDDNLAMEDLLGMKHVELSVYSTGSAEHVLTKITADDEIALAEFEAEDELDVTGRIAQLQSIWRKFDPMYENARIWSQIVAAASVVLAEVALPLLDISVWIKILLGIGIGVVLGLLFALIRYRWLPYVQVVKPHEPNQWPIDKQILWGTFVIAAGTLVLDVYAIVDHIHK